MSMFKRAWLLITRRSLHSLYLFLLIVIFSFFITIGFYFEGIIENYHKLVFLDVGYSVCVFNTDGTAFSDELVAELTQIEGVSRINIEEDCLAKPINFVNRIKDDTSDVFVPAISEEVRLLGNMDVSENAIFKNRMSLVAGKFPNKDLPGALIDEYLSEQNGITIGDNLMLSINNSCHVITFPVVGIYHSITPPQESQLTDGGYSAYGQSPYSYVFCDIDSYSNALDIHETSTYILYSDSIRSHEKVKQSIEELDLPIGEYSFYSRTDGQLKGGTTAYRAIDSASTILVLGSIVITTIVLLITVMIWMHNCYHDIAKLIVLGQYRCSIIGQFFIMITIIAGLALITSLPICILTVSCCRDYFLEYLFRVTGVLNSFEIDDYLIVAMNQGMRVSSFVKSFSSCLLATWIATAFSSVEIIFCKVIDLFDVR